MDSVIQSPFCPHLSPAQGGFLGRRPMQARSQCLDSCSAVTVVKFLTLFQQEPPYFHFALDTTTGVVLALSGHRFLMSRARTLRVQDRKAVLPLPPNHLYVPHMKKKGTVSAPLDSSGLPSGKGVLAS